MKCKEWRRWLIVSIDELTALAANGALELCRRAAGRNMITSKWVFKIKYAPNNLIDRYKTRLVARGFTQVQGIDYEETFAPISSLESLRILVAFAILYGFEIEQMDVPNTYLQSYLEEETRMENFSGVESKALHLGLQLKTTVIPEESYKPYI